MRKLIIFPVLIVCSHLIASRLWAGFDQDPIAETRSDAVPVTEESLKREGQAGPASPTYPMADTSGFLVKVPYEKAGEGEVDDKEASSDHFWDRWFFWKKNEKSAEISEPIENE